VKLSEKIWGGQIILQNHWYEIQQDNKNAEVFTFGKSVKKH